MIEHLSSYIYLKFIDISSTHKDALIQALSQIRVETTTTLEGLIHMMTAGKATCIVFFDDDLPPESLDHTRPLYISVGCSGHRVSFILLDNGPTLKVCLLAIAITLSYAPFIHDGQVVIVQFIGDMFASFKLVF